MSIVWNDNDQNRIECLKELVSRKGDCLMISEGAKGFIKFEVLDYYKANSLLMEISDFAQSTKVTDVTGIKVTEIGYASGMHSDKIEKIQNHLNAIYNIIHDQE